MAINNSIYTILLLVFFSSATAANNQSDDVFTCYDKGYKFSERQLLGAAARAHIYSQKSKTKDMSYLGFIKNMNPNALMKLSMDCGRMSTHVWDSTGKELPDSPSKFLSFEILKASDQIFYKMAHDTSATKNEYGICKITPRFLDRVFGKYSTKRHSFKGEFPLSYEVCSKYGGSYQPILNSRPHKRVFNGKTTIFIGGNYWATENEFKKTENSTCMFTKDKDCKKYGTLYTYEEADVCPEGFKLPSDDDYQELFSFGAIDSDYDIDSFLSQEFNKNKGQYLGVDIPLDGIAVKATVENEYLSRIRKEDGFFIIKKGAEESVVQGEAYFGSQATFRADSGVVIIDKEKSRPYNYYRVHQNSEEEKLMHTRCILDPNYEEPDTIPNYIAGTMRDPRDGKTYKTILVDDLTWMAENLNYKTGKSLCYDNKESNCNKYGRLYTWNDAEKACPDGWKLPSMGFYAFMASIFNGLFDEGLAGYLLNRGLLNENKNTGGKGFKSKSRDWINNGAGTDDLSFNALPAGTYFKETGFIGIENSTAFWTSDYSKKNQKHYTIMLKGNSDIVYQGMQSADNSALSIRCVLDNTKKSNGTASKPSSTAPTVPQEVPFGFLTIDVKHSVPTQQNSALIEVDGKIVSMGKNKISAGQHTLKISANCQESISEEITVKEKTNTNIRKVLQPAKGNLNLIAIRDLKEVKEPVFFNNKKIGTTPFSGNVPTCGIITIGKENKVVPVTIQENKTTSFRFDFTPSKEEPPQNQKTLSNKGSNNIIRIPLAKIIQINYNGAEKYLNEEDVTKIIKEQKESIEESYRNFVERKGRTTTIIKFKIAVDFTQGNVKSVQDVSEEVYFKDTRHTLLFKTIAQNIRKWKFKKQRKGGIIFIEFPIKFDEKT